MIQDGAQRTQLDSVLMIGQSNMAGRGDFGEVKPIRNPLCYMLRMGRWQPMCEPVNPDRGIFEGRFRSGVSLAASFAEEYAKKFQRPVGLIPCADGGTCLSQWMPGELNYDHAVLQTKLALRNSCLRAIIWHQGESECKSDEDVRTYKQRFTSMLRQLREDLDAKDVPVILGELSGDITEKWVDKAYLVQMNCNLRELAREIPYCAIASSRGLGLKADGLHFNAEACREFGKRYFEAYCSTQQNK